MRGVTSATVTDIAQRGDGVRGSDRLVMRGIAHVGTEEDIPSAVVEYAANLVLVGTGARPVTELAQRAGVMLGAEGAIRVTRAIARRRR